MRKRFYTRVFTNVMDFELFLNIHHIKLKEIININATFDKIIVCLYLSQRKIDKLTKWYKEYNHAKEDI